MSSQTAFARAWNRQFFIGASVLAGDRSALAETQRFRLPGDFESHEAIVVVADGLLLTTTQAVNANIEAGHDSRMITRFLGGQLGAAQIVVLEPLRGEHTAHVDMFACFTSADTVVVGEYAKSVDRVNAAVLDRNAARLAEIHVEGKKLNVVRIPMPSNRDGVWRTYTNVVFADGTLLVPGYPRVSMVSQRRAMAVYERCLPGWKVVSVDLRALIRHEGGLRCISTYVPSRRKGPEPQS